MPVRDRIQQRRFVSSAAEVVVGLVVAADHLTSETGALCERFGVTADQYNVLRILRGAGPGGLARKEVSDRLMRRSPDVTRLVDRLVAQGLVERTPGRDDRRLSIARVTVAGLELLRAIDPEMEALMAELTAALSERDKRELARLCDALVP